MTDHAGAVTIPLEMGFLTIDAGVKQPIAGTIPLHFIVNGTWIAGQTDLITTVTGAATLYPPLSFLDSEGLKLTRLNFEGIYGGSKTGVQTITAVNGTDSSITVTLTPEVSPSQIGSSSDTYGSLYLSNDDSLYYQTIDVVVAANDTTDFYVYYQPPSNAKIGYKEWNLDLDTNIVIGDWLYGDNLTITSISPVSEYDTIILVTVDYVAGKMETDFSDIRFWMEGQLLDSSIYNKVDSDYANFTVMIPALSSGEILTLNVLSGNSTVDVKQDYVYTEGWDWLDNTLSPWVEGGGSVQSYTATHNSSYFGHYTMYSYCYGSYPATWASVVATGAYGRWVMNYALLGGDYHNPASLNWPYRNRSLTKWSFIHNGTNSYNFRINTDAETIGLYYNDTLLDEAAFSRSVNNTHTLEITRDLNGNFIVKIDGTTYLTATDTTITSSIKEEVYFISYAWGRGLEVDLIHFIEEEQYPPTVSAFDNWDDRLDLPCYGDVLLQSRELPELDPERRYGCRVGGVYYE